MKRRLPSGYTDYILQRLHSFDVVQVKRGLQQLCDFYRGELVIVAPDKLSELRIKLNGHVVSVDAKVRRWALNAIALAGSKSANGPAVNIALENYRDDPEVFGAAVAAAVAIDPKAFARLVKDGRADHDLLVLSALQHVKVPVRALRKTRVDIENATPDVLKLSLVLVGTGKAPEHIFHPRHENRAVVRALGKHDDAIVAQYSVWSATENADLGIQDIGIDVKDLERHPANVRGWTNRLMGMDAEYAQFHLDYVLRGSQDPASEARLGLATGIRATFFDGLPEITTDWYVSEEDQEIRACITDHMAQNNEREDRYRDFVEDEYQRAAEGSLQRRRIEALCEGSPLYRDLRKLTLTSQMGQLDLAFVHIERQEVSMNKNINIGGNVQAGTISTGDNAVSANTTNYSAEKLVLIRQILDEATQVLNLEGVPADIRAEGLKKVEDAKKDPAPGRLAQVADIFAKLGKIVGGAKTAVEGGSAIAAKIMEVLASLST